MVRERTYRAEAVVMRRVDFGEADRLLTLYSREYGKIKGIAKGARKPQSRKTGHVELFMRSRFFIAKGRNLDIITQAETIEPYVALRADLVRATYASYAVELLDRFTVEEDQQLDLYDLLVNGLGWFATAEDVLLAARYYELRLLSLAGFQPQFFQCVSCGEAVLEQDQFFSVEMGGFLCPDCAHADRNALPVTAVTVKVLRYLQTRPWNVVEHLRLRKPLLHDLERVMHAYITHTLERNLKSVDFLHRLRQEAALFAGDEVL
jgi:DNA repair protein RecO (recombination protein O)